MFRNLIVVSLLLLTVACESKRVIDFPESDLSSTPLIPKPLAVSADSSGFPLDQYTFIRSEGPELEEVAQYLSKKIEKQTGLKLPVNDKSERIESVISLEAKEGLAHEEAYTLRIQSDSIILQTSTPAAAFRGIQTIRQIIPSTSNDTLAENPIWVIPTGKINDQPEFDYRSTMLDVARHFFTVEDLKKYIDILAYYKYNHLHLHLSDDQGWRIEIKSWPKLTEIGGSTEVGGEAGGYFTQEDYQEIVAFAAQRYITIVPEIDMPGHTNAASVSYPFLNGNGKTPELYEGTRVGFSTLDTRKDTVYKFIDDVVREISAITPGPYFHIGGDESHVTSKADYNYFVDRVEQIVQKYGKRMIGWDEVASTNIDSTSIAQWWRSPENAKAAVSKGMKVILSPGSKAYLDMKYDSLSLHGLTWAGYITTKTAYDWHPSSYLEKRNILGIEAPLWSETISDISELEYLAFPRVIGYAELGWSSEENRSWQDYKTRLAKQKAYLDRLNVNFHPSPLVDWPKQTVR